MKKNNMIPAQMMAVVTTGNGGFDKLEYKKVNTPNPNNNEVLVKVLAAGINNTEINTRLGWYSSSDQLQLTGKTSVLGTLTYSAKAPSKFEAIHIFCLDLKPFIRMHDLMITLLPNNELSLLFPKDTTSPQQSVPWINGN